MHSSLLDQTAMRAARLLNRLERDTKHELSGHKWTTQILAISEVKVLKLIDES